MEWLERTDVHPECELKHACFAQSMRYLDTVMREETLISLIEFTKRLEGTYRGESFWCDASQDNAEWLGFFSILANVANVGPIAGAEWWIRRAVSNQSKDFHFDKDEHLFRRNGQLKTPLWSSVLYLTSGGPTLICDGDPGALRSNEKSPTSMAAAGGHRNQLLIFPGHLCHGVAAIESVEIRLSLIVNWWPRRPTRVAPFRLPGTLPPLEISECREAKVRCRHGEIFRLAES